MHTIDCVAEKASEICNMKPTGFQFKPPAEEMDAAQLIDQETQNTGRSAGRTRGIPVCLRVKHI